jgi:predicted ATPase
MASGLTNLTIKGFKSIKSLDNFELKNLNVLIGGNGAGKSNLIDFFRLLRAMMELPLPGLDKASLVSLVTDFGKSDDFLFNGPKVTANIEAEMHFGDYRYKFKLTPTTEGSFLINDESKYYTRGNTGWWNLGSGHQTPKVLQNINTRGASGGKSIEWHIYECIASWKIYHFHDTSKFSGMRRREIVDDAEYLRFDAANIAPYLLRLRESESKTYQKIVDTIQLVAPFFGDFILVPDKNDNVRIRWRQKGSDYTLKPQHLSDGTIRFICLTTALLQPKLPSTFIIDEPELGLHPFAIEILAELIQSVSEQTQ